MGSGTAGFVPGRLIEAREARGLTMTQLADLVGITKQSVSAYETGKKTPSTLVLGQLAEQLNMPVHFFMQPLSQQHIHPVFFRSLANTTKRARIRAERRLGWLESIVEYLADFVELLPVNIPRLYTGEDPNGLSVDEIEHLAGECRKAFMLGNGPISNMVRLLENNGALITRQDLDTTSLDAFSMWSSRLNAPIIIMGADKDSAVRSRMDAAHELAHLVLHRSITDVSRFHALIEQQAKRFAGAFLLPAETFARDLGALNLNSFWALKSRWKVSIGGMIYRCQELGILNEERATRLWINYTRSGFRKREPLDDSLSLEKPVFLGRCFELIISTKVRSGEDILAELPLARSDIEDLTGLDRGYLEHRPAQVQRLPQLRHGTTGQQSSSKGVVIPFQPKKQGD